MRLTKAQKGLLQKHTDTHGKLSSLLTWWDMRESRKKYHNIYALSQYFAAMNLALEAIKKGATIEAAIESNFIGRLQTYLIKNVKGQQQ